MYCDKCHKQSPDNFVTCAYCGAKLNSPKKKEPSKFIKKREFKFNFSFKNRIIALVIFAAVLVVVAVVTVSFTGSKPEKVVKNFVKATQTADKDLYYSLYDDNIKKYKKDNRYFGDDETYAQIVQPMEKSDVFYTEKCGEDYKLTYKVTSSQTLSDEDLSDFNDVLENGFGYVEFPSRVDILCIEVVAKGVKGEYKSVYNDFWCMKIKGRWYKIDKTVYTEYINSNQKTS